MPKRKPEAFSRVLIDDALRESGWDILDDREVELELSGTSGRADYILNGWSGPLCVLEAKPPNENEDPYDAKEQARGYAENINAPFIILSNGVIHYFWDWQNSDQDAYRIERLPSQKDLIRMTQKNLQPAKSLKTDVVTQNYLATFDSSLQLRNYQIRALDAIEKGFDKEGRRKFLLEMATGTGKTLLCAALIRRFLQTRNAERVLFIVDRIELAKQTLETFDIALRDYKPVIYKTARKKPMELMGSSVVIATIQSLQVDRRYREEFTPYYFDLIINDEAHRSIYGNSREVVQYFQGTRVGLTATPKAYLKNIDVTKLSAEDPKALEARELRDTYHYFGCEPGKPTFRYDILDAMKDPEGPYLVLPKIYDIRSEITTQALAENGWIVKIDEQDESYKVNQLEKEIFIPERNRLICEQILKNGLRDPEDNFGKTIVFAVNQRHATELTKILNSLKPGIAITITSRIKDASTIAKEFRDGKRKERIAISVDMLSTGYNCLDILNIVLARPIFSPTEYIQIKGRGTRLHTFRAGKKEYRKAFFNLLDFCGVAEYFEEKYDYSIPLTVPKIAKKSEKTVKTQKVSGKSGSASLNEDERTSAGSFDKAPVPIWTGRDVIDTSEIKIVGPNGEKVDVMTFRGSYERDLKKLYKQDMKFKKAVDSEDDDQLVTILSEKFFNRPEMYYTPAKLIKSYGIPAPVSTFVYGPLDIRPMPTKANIIEDTVQSIAARYNLRYQEQRILNALTQLVAEDRVACRQFFESNLREIFERPQFAPLGGVDAIISFESREKVFEALRETPLVQQIQLAD